MNELKHSEQTVEEHSEEGHQETVPKKVEKTVTGHDEPLEEKHPRVGAALVWAVYPLVLIVLLIIAIAVFRSMSQ